jgi:hypothetical protein
MSCHLSVEQIRSFKEYGYLAIDSLLDEADLKPLHVEYALLLDRLTADLYARGITYSPWIP